MTRLDGLRIDAKTRLKGEQVELRIAAAWYALGKFTTEKAIDAAHAALNDGVYSEALGEVIFAEPRWSEIGPLFERALSELGVGVPDRATAVQRLARDYACRIVSSHLSPYEGAKSICWELAYEPEAGDSLLPFIGLASEWEDCPEYRPEYEADIIQAAHELAGSSEVESNTVNPARTED